MTDGKQETNKGGGVDLKDQELDQIQAGAALAQRSASSPSSATRRSSGWSRIDFGLLNP